MHKLSIRSLIMKTILLKAAILTVCSAGVIINNAEDCNEIKDNSIACVAGGDDKIYKVNLKASSIDEADLTENLKDLSKLTYWLYTRDNPCDVDEIVYCVNGSLDKSHFNCKRDTVILVHGWLNNRHHEMCQLLRTAFLNAVDVNVFLLDWNEIAKLVYHKAVSLVPAIGEKLGLFIKWLIKFGVTYERIHLVGYGVGAHIVGNAGRCTGGKVRRITALNPAGACWRKNKNRITKSNGQYVEVIHTCTIGEVGISEPCGHVDHYPNGGRVMPGCEYDVLCSHARSYKYMASSIEHNFIMSQKCANLKSALEMPCSGRVVPMGNAYTNKTGCGIYRGETTEFYPYETMVYG